MNAFYAYQQVKVDKKDVMVYVIFKCPKILSPLCQRIVGMMKPFVKVELAKKTKK